MDLMEIATELFLNKVGAKKPETKMDGGLVKMALGMLLGGDDGQLDIGDLVSKFQGGDLMDIAASWLGDGDNKGVSATQILDILGQDKVSDFASKIGIDNDTASTGLAETIPDLIDQSSKGGSLLDAVGGVGGLASIAGKFF